VSFILAYTIGTCLGFSQGCSQKGLGFPFLRGLRLSQLPSLGQEPLWVSFRALGAAPDCYEKETPAPSARFPKYISLERIRPLS